MVTVKCLLTFKKIRIKERPIFASGVKDGIFGNPTVFPSPPISEQDLIDMIADFTAKRSLYENGGKAQKPAWDAANTLLISALVKMAEYVDTLVNGDPNVVILSGFRPSKGSYSDATIPGKANGVTLKRDAEISGKLIADCTKLSTANSYICILTEGAPLPPSVIVNDKGQLIMQYEMDGPDSGADAQLQLSKVLSTARIDLNQNRRKEFTHLTPFKTYYAVFLGVNAAGVGALSNPVSVVCV